MSRTSASVIGVKSPDAVGMAIVRDASMLKIAREDESVRCMMMCELKKIRADIDPRNVDRLEIEVQNE